VTHHEKVTREEIARRNYTEGTTRAYLRVLDDLAGYFQQPPERLKPEQIREYTAHLFRDKKLADNTVNQMVGALRFFYLKVLNKPWRGHEMPYPKKSMHLPVIWSPEEIGRLIDAAPTPFYRTILMTLYATGMRRAEVAALKLADVDSARMVLHVQEGKGRKDRDIVLSPNLLLELRQHYRRLRRKPEVWLFPGGTHHTADTPITEKVVWHACRRAAQRCGVNKPLHPHTLRHCFATHLVEAGADLRTVQLLLGHSDLRETMIYIHLSKRHLAATASPLDALSLTAK
jgi:site-specific recombinase XerD